MSSDEITPEQLLAMLDKDIDLSAYLDTEPLPVLIDDPLPLITDIT